MNKQVGSLIFGIVLLVIALANLAVMATKGGLTLHTIVLDGSLLIFAVSRFMMFANPQIMLIKPMRTIALVGVLASYIMPKA
jgi:hypothetical protein